MKKFDDSIPIYLQIKEEIENAVIKGTLKEDEAIPSIRVLAQQYRLNPQTISSAFSELLSEDILFKKRGIGMFVQNGAKKILIKKKQIEFRENIFQTILQKGKTINISKDEMIDTINKFFEENK